MTQDKLDKFKLKMEQYVKEVIKDMNKETGFNLESQRRRSYFKGKAIGMNIVLDALNKIQGE